MMSNFKRTGATLLVQRALRKMRERAEKPPKSTCWKMLPWNRSKTVANVCVHELKQQQQQRTKLNETVSL